MNSCSHSNLMQMPQPEKKLRCQHCHLVISADELKNGYCPECFEMKGNKRYDFEEIAPSQITSTQFKCEDCGVIIESE